MKSVFFKLITLILISTLFSCNENENLEFNEESYKDAVLVNISEAGALIGVNEKLDLDTQLYLLLESTEENQEPVQMLAEIIRSADSIDGYTYCYGCMILDVL